MTDTHLQPKIAPGMNNPFKARFRWKEPAAYVKRRDQEQKKGDSRLATVLAVLVTSGVTMLIWFLATLDPKKTPPSFPAACIMSLFSGFFVALVIPWMNRLSPSLIRVTRSRFVVNRGQAMISLSWKEVASFHFDADDGVPVICVESAKGRKITVGLDPAVDYDALRQFLIERGVVTEQSLAAGDLTQELQKD